MRVYLSAIGWVAEAPFGNRLRWLYPTTALNRKGEFLGLPEKMVVERAPIHEDVVNQTKYGIVSSTVPSWWDNYGTVTLNGFLPLVYKFPNPVQAVSFTYAGSETLFIAFESESNNLVNKRILKNGDDVYLEASGIDTLFFVTFPSVKIENLKALDLFKDQGLEWETIAEINVLNAFGQPYEEAMKRYGGASTFLPSQWNDIINLLGKAKLSIPTSQPKNEPLPWNTFNWALGIRWEYAVIGGMGFCDGPQTQATPLDKVEIAKLLKNVPSTAYAYRVREMKNRTKPSNIMICPNFVAPPLLPPAAPTYVNPQVKLTAYVIPQVNPTPNDAFQATYDLTWNQFSPSALGVEFEEQTSSSPSIPQSNPSDETFECRSRHADIAPLQGNLSRSIEVAFHDVTLKCRCKASDGWDRESVYSPWTPPTPLALLHNPQPPSLDSATFDNGTTTILRAVGASLLSDWTPDIILEKASAKLFIYRKNMKPRVETVNVTQPVPVQGDLYKTSATTTLTNSADFVEGQIVAGGFKTSITATSGNDIFFHVPYSGGGTAVLFNAGMAKLQQNPKRENLWIKVAEFPINGLPIQLVFNDPVPGPGDAADVLSYYARLSFLGRLGPAGNIVTALRVPAAPNTPPPFTVELIGIDFYMRTMVKIKLTNPSSDLFTVWWADNLLNPDDFTHQAVPGECKAQQAQGGLFLYDVLSLPIPNKASRDVTIGIQTVNASGGQSTFSTVQMTLLAL